MAFVGVEVLGICDGGLGERVVRLKGMIGLPPGMTAWEGAFPRCQGMPGPELWAFVL